MPRRFLLTTALLLVPAIAMAHEGAGDQHFAHGFAHPFFGLDHLLAMLASGLLAVRIGKALGWVVPVAFLTAMAAGFGLGHAFGAVPGMEWAIAASVIVIGAAVALPHRLPVWVAAIGIALCALPHGMAHAVEMPTGDLTGYLVGMLLGTALLHVPGVVWSWFAPTEGADDQSPAPSVAVRIAGGAIAVAGVVLTTGLAIA